MLQRDRRPPFNSSTSEHDELGLPPKDSPLPRFEIAEASNSPSLAPVASDISDEDEDWKPPTVSRSVRRFRAAALFVTIIVPVCLLALFEVVTLGGSAFRDVLPSVDEPMAAAQSWGATLMSGRNEARLEASAREEPLTDDEARDLAAMELEQVMGLARVACVDEGMPPITLWVTTTVTQDGKVGSVAVEGPTLGRAHVASCVGGIARHMHIPEFRGEPVVASREITIR